MKHALFALGLALFAGQAQAGPNDILIGLDQKVAYGPEGAINGAPGKDELLILDTTKPEKPTIRARLPMSNSLLGPPTNLQITPDGKLGLIASSVIHTPDEEGFKVSPDDRLFVVDLTASPPKLVDTLNIGKQPSGMAISRKGDLALVANRFGKSVSVLSIDSGAVTPVNEIPLGEEATAVEIAPDGKRAFVCLNLANTVAVLNIDGRKVTRDKAMDIPVAFNPYNVEFAPNGKFAIVSHLGSSKNNADFMALIDPSGAHPHIVGAAAPGQGPEGFAISPDGKWVATGLLLGSGARPSDWSRTKGGELVLMAFDQDKGTLTVADRAPIGALPQGIAFSPKSDFVYVGDFIDDDLLVFRVNGGHPKPAGQPIKLGGQPASMRGPAR